MKEMPDDQRTKVHTKKGSGKSAYSLHASAILSYPVPIARNYACTQSAGVTGNYECIAIRRNGVTTRVKTENKNKTVRVDSASSMPPLASKTPPRTFRGPSKDLQRPVQQFQEASQNLQNTTISLRRRLPKASHDAFETPRNLKCNQKTRGCLQYTPSPPQSSPRQFQEPVLLLSRHQ